MAENNIKPLNGLYNKLVKKGANVPEDYATFEAAFTAPGKEGASNRHTLYDKVGKYGLQDGDDYSTWYATYFQPISKNSSKARDAGTPMSITERNNMMAKTAGMMYANLNSAERAEKSMKRSKQRTGLSVGKAELGKNSNVAEMQTGEWDTEKNAPGKTYVTETGNEYDTRFAADQEQNALDEAREQREKTEQYLLQKKARLTEDLDRRAKEIDQEVDEHDGGNWFTNLLKESAAGGNPLKTRDVREGKYEMARKTDTKYSSLQASLAQIDDALDAIKEGKKGKASDEWIADSDSWYEKTGKNILAFGAGSLRGLANAVGKVSTWDMGASDLANNNAILNAVDKAGNEGENMDNLSTEERDLLNLTALSNKVQEDNEQYIGRGYKAGQVTGESLEMMAEMGINPLSGLGKGAMKTAMKQMVKKYGKEAVKRNVGKYLAAKIGTRVIGDALGAVGMAATTGIQKVGADALQRMTGNVKYGYDDHGKVVYFGVDKRDKAGNALVKALFSTSIENQSEMVGEYFKPFITGSAKLLSKGMTKVGLDSVNKFLNSVGTSDFAKMISNFESKAKWSGTLGEYMEEVIGNIENGLLVGDQTFDTKEGTGIFNLDKILIQDYNYLIFN